jgi:hypothetical protein
MLQGFVFVNNDPEMVDAQGQHAKARNTNLNEDLGKVRYHAAIRLWTRCACICFLPQHISFC